LSAEPHISERYPSTPGANAARVAAAERAASVALIAGGLAPNRESSGEEEEGGEEEGEEEGGEEEGEEGEEEAGEAGEADEVFVVFEGGKAPEEAAPSSAFVPALFFAAPVDLGANGSVDCARAALGPGDDDGPPKSAPGSRSSKKATRASWSTAGNWRMLMGQGADDEEEEKGPLMAALFLLPRRPSFRLSALCPRPSSAGGRIRPSQPILMLARGNSSGKKRPIVLVREEAICGE